MANPKINRVSRVCVNCGRTFITQALYVNRGQMKSCSNKCRDEQRKLKRRTLADRFWEKVERNSGVFAVVDGVLSECWIWTASTCGPHRNYGQIILDSTPNNFEKAHRASWALNCGPIPDGLCVCHKCDHPLCVRPSHLFLGTQKDNSEDMVKKGRSLQGSAHHNSKLTESDIPQIKALVASGLTMSETGALFDIRSSAVCRIVSGKTWTHVK